MSVPEPIRLTPTGPGYRSLGCPTCRWHKHQPWAEDPDALREKYEEHYREEHGS